MATSATSRLRKSFAPGSASRSASTSSHRFCRRWPAGPASPSRTWHSNKDRRVRSRDLSLLGEQPHLALGVDVVGFDLDRLPEVRQGRLVVPGELGDLAEKVIGGSAMLALLDRGLKILGRFGVRAFLVLDAAELGVPAPGVELRHVRAAADRFVEHLHRLGKTLRLDQIATALESFLGHQYLGKRQHFFAAFLALDDLLVVGAAAIVGEDALGLADKRED